MSTNSFEEISKLKQKISKLKEKTAPFEERKEKLGRENKDLIERREKVESEKESLEIKINRKRTKWIAIVIIIISLIIIVGITSEGNYPIEAVIVWGSFALISLLYLIFPLFTKAGKRRKLNALQEEYEKLCYKLSDYDRKVQEIDSECSDYYDEIYLTESKIERIEKEEKMQKYAKNYIIVYAGATFNGHLDRDIQRNVIIDGMDYGTAMPWKIIGLNPGFHMMCVQYTDRVGGNTYTGRTDSVSFRVDDGSKIYSCYKRDKHKVIHQSH